MGRRQQGQMEVQLFPSAARAQLSQLPSWSWSSKPCRETRTQTLVALNDVRCLQPGPFLTVFEACNLLKYPVKSPELAIFGCPQLQVHCERYRSFRERGLAELPNQMPTHVSKCHQWELRHHNPAHNAPLKTFQQLN